MWRWILGGSLTAAALLVVATVSKIACDTETIFWHSQTSFLKKTIKKAEQIVGRPILGCKLFMQKTMEGVEAVAKFYSKAENGCWVETTITRVLPEHNVPSHILQRLPNSERVEVTDMLEMQLKKIESEES